MSCFSGRIRKNKWRKTKENKTGDVLSCYIQQSSIHSTLLSVAAPGSQGSQVISRSLRSWGRSSGTNASAGAVKETGHFEVRKSSSQVTGCIFSSKKLTIFLPRCMECRRGLAMRILSVSPPSVRPSVCQRRALWQNGKKSVQFFIPCKRPFTLVFWEKEWLVGASNSAWNFGSTGSRWSEISDFEPIIARNASAVTSSAKSSIITNRKSTTRFPMSLRWTSYVVAKPQRVLKNAKCPKLEQ